MGPSGSFHLPGSYGNGGRGEVGRMGIPSKKQLSDPSQICEGTIHILALDVSDPQMTNINCDFYEPITKILTGIANTVHVL